MTTKKAEAKAPAEPKEAQFKLTLDEFCAGLSRTDNRISLIGGFHAAEKRARRTKDTEAAYRARFEQFTKQPA